MYYYVELISAVLFTSIDATSFKNNIFNRRTLTKAFIHILLLMVLGNGAGI